MNLPIMLILDRESGKYYAVPAIQGTPGTSIESITIDENNHLIVTLTDGTTKDAGELPGGGGGAVLSVNGQTGDVELTAADVGADPAGTAQELVDGLSIPAKTSDLQNDSKFITLADVPAAPVTSVNDKTGAINLTYADVGADQVGAAGTAVAEHNVDEAAHNDIRLFIEEVNNRLNTFMNSEDIDLDQAAEFVAYMKANRSLIESITTSKVSVSDIIDNLITNVSNKPLSAAQGVALKALIDGIKIPTNVSEFTNDAGYLATESDPTVPAWAKAASKPTYTKSDVGLGNLDNVKQYSASNPPPYPVTSVNGETGAVTIDIPDALSDLTDDSTHRVVTDAEKAAWNGKVGKTSLTLGVHTDGLVYIFIDGVPVGNGIEQGVNSDVVGYVDESNNIILTGDLPEAVYTVKYEMEDGTTVNIGELSLVEPSTSRLPAEYQEVEWVRIMNAETVDIHANVHTNVPWNTANRIVAKLQNVNSSNTNDIIFSAWSSETAKATPYIATRTSKATNMYGAQSGLTTFAVSPNNIEPTDLNANVFEFAFTASSTADMCFGGWYDATFSHPHKWYYVEIYNGETLLANFIPCYRKSDNTNGFYDLVGGAFYLNSDTGSDFAYRGDDV